MRMMVLSWSIRQFLSTPSARRATPGYHGRDIFKPFLSTPSARRATTCDNGTEFSDAISIHALREEGDTASAS